MLIFSILWCKIFTSSFDQNVCILIMSYKRLTKGEAVANITNVIKCGVIMNIVFSYALALMMLLTMVACGGEASTGNSDDLSVEVGSDESPKKVIETRMKSEIKQNPILKRLRL